MARLPTKRVRVAVLLTVLLIVVLYAWSNIRSRRARNDWARPLNVVIVLVADGAVDPAAIESMRARVPVLEARLADELHRYRGTPARPFYFVLRGPVPLHAPLPVLAGEGTVDLAKHAWALSRWAADVDGRAQLQGSAFDARVYAVIRPPSHEKPRFVEGSSEQGGRIATLEVDLDTSMVDFALFVSAHELFHTVGALDKYDATGATLIPDGLAEPEAPFPQKHAEIMGRGRVIAPGNDELPDSLEVLRVNPITAREIGWVK
jgi:hypothetical protein